MKTTMQAMAVAALGMALAAPAWGHDDAAFGQQSGVYRLASDFGTWQGGPYATFNASNTNVSVSVRYPCHRGEPLSVSGWLGEAEPGADDSRGCVVWVLRAGAAGGFGWPLPFHGRNEFSFNPSVPLPEMNGRTHIQLAPETDYTIWAVFHGPRVPGARREAHHVEHIHYRTPSRTVTPTPPDPVTVSVESTGGLAVRITVTARDDEAGQYTYPIALPVTVFEEGTNLRTHTVDLEIPRGGSATRVVTLGKHGTQYRFGGSSYWVNLSGGGSQLATVPVVDFTTPPESEPEPCPVVERCDHIAIVPSMPRAVSGDEDAPDHWLHVTNPGAAGITFTVTGRDGSGTKGATYRRELPAYRGVRVKMRDIEAAFDVTKPEGWWTLTVTGTGPLSVGAGIRQGDARRFVPVERPAVCGTGR